MRIFNMPYDLFIQAVASMAILGAILWILTFTAPIRDKIEAHGVDATAKVTELGPIVRGPRTTRGSRLRMVTYVFTTEDGARIEGTRRGGRAVWSGLEIGSQVGVRYLPAAPERHTAAILPGYAGREMALFLIPALAATAGLGWRAWRRQPPDWDGPKLRPLLRFG